MMYNNNFVVVVKCDGKVLREHNKGTVYLPFGSEYSILIKNKDARRALVDIEVDGKSVLNGHKLIVGGNTAKEIKGFMRDMDKTNKFKFINKTKEIQNYRGDRIDDGLVRVAYQFEKQEDQPVFINYGYDFNKFLCDNTKSLVPDSTNDTLYGSSISFNCSFNSAPAADEGITVKGKKINQTYVHGNIGELERAIYTIILQLRGKTSRKQSVKKAITVKSKTVCETCGRKNKTTNKFCYNCGTCLE